MIIKFGNIEVDEQKFHQYKRPISIKNIDINKIQYLIKSFSVKNGFKYFIAYKDVKAITLLYIFLPKMSAYRRDFD